MKIEIKADEEIVTMDDGDFNVPGWINIKIKDVDVDIHINDLLPAVESFDIKYKRDKEM